MSDPVAAIGAALYAALSAPGVVSVPVYQHAPENSAMPVVIIGDIEDVAAIGRAGDDDRRAVISLITLTEGESRAECITLMGEQTAALDGAQFSQSGWTIETSFLRGSVTLAEDGLGYIGLAQFQVLALG